MQKVIASLFILLCIGLLSVKLYTEALHSSDYVGLPTVPCQDYTLPIKQNYSLTIKIMIINKPYPLTPTIGHDFGKCLHDIYTNDRSGKVFVRTNDTNTYTLGQFFDVWHVTFNKNQIFGYETDQTHHVEVFVNGHHVADYRSASLLPNEIIEVTYL